MSILLDTGIVYAYYDRSDAWHARARTLIEIEHRGLLLPAPVIPEVDHLLGRRLGAASQLAFYAGMVQGAYVVTELPRDGYGRVAELHRQFSDLALGFVDLAIVTLAAKLKLSRIATTDRRHFAPLARAFALELLP